MNDFLSMTNLGNIEHPNCVPRKDYASMLKRVEELSVALRLMVDDYREFHAEVESPGDKHKHLNCGYCIALAALGGAK